LKDTQPAATDSGKLAREGILTWGAAAACIVFIIWMGIDWTTIRSRDTYVGKKTDYYSLLVNGFLSGHLYMARDGYPDWSNPDPAVRAKAPHLLDASYYRGRYYLYFGVTPAALLLLPYAWITGGNLDPRWVVVLCTALGFLFSVGILRMASRDHFQRLDPWFQCAAVASVAFASVVPSLLAWAKFYEVAIATGYACTMAGAFWTYRAISGRGPPCLQLVLASISFGLAVGCRPNLVMDIPVLAAAAALVVWRDRKRNPCVPGLLINGTAALAPAACVGALLALYNYERFGNPFEFGMAYSMNAFRGDGHPLFATAYFWPNLHWYYLTLPALSPYFPYVYPEEAYFGPPAYRGGEAIHGQFAAFVLFAFVAITAVTLRKRLRLGLLAGFLGLVAWMFLGVFLAISAIGIRADRYMVDFQAPLVLGIALVATAVSSVLGDGRGPRLWRAAFATLAALAVAFNVFAGLQEFSAFKNNRISTYRSLESLGNYPAYWFEKVGLFRAGPIELKIVFPTEVKEAAVEPLLAAGTPEFTDSLYVIENSPGDRIEFRGDHSGYGGPQSDPISITPGRTYTLLVDMGALYPPRGPPFTGEFKSSQGRQLKTRIHVEMDGRTVFDRRMDSYDAPPWSLQIGKNTATMNPFKTQFSGRILSATRLPPPMTTEKQNDGLWRIHCVFPLQPNASYPLLSGGVEGSGTLIYLTTLPNNRVQFGLDEWSIGGGLSEALPSVPGVMHTVEILIGPLAKNAKWPKEWAISQSKLERLGRTLVVWLDGRPVWTFGLRQPVDPLESMFDVGGNSQGFSTALAEYPAPIQSVPFGGDEAREFLDRNLKIEPQ
jgi:hypothetical protein